MRNQEANDKVTFKLRAKNEDGPVLVDRRVGVGIILEKCLLDGENRLFQGLNYDLQNNKACYIFCKKWGRYCWGNCHCSLLEKLRAVCKHLVAN